MGSQQNTYVGPYLAISNLPSTQGSESLYTCSNTKCNIRGKQAVGKFCSSCGAANTTINKTKQVTTSAYELMNEFGSEDIMFALDTNKGYNLLPNRRNKYSISYDDSEGYVEKDLMDKQVAIEEFSTEYKAFLDFLASKSVAYDIKFGVLAYYW